VAHALSVLHDLMAPTHADVSTAILSAAAGATPKTLSAALAQDWVAQLDAARRQTQVRVALAGGTRPP
jgi:hypothetical protein